MGIHRNVIHPVFGKFILLGTILIGADVDSYGRPLDYNPCLECQLCVAACPTGAIGSDGAFNFGACSTHNYREFMGGFSDWVDTVAASDSAAAYRKNVTQAETVSMWQSLSYGANYKAAHCVAVCPAGADVIGPFLADRGGFVADVVKPLQDKAEVVYVTRDSDAETHVAKRFKNKRTKVVSGGCACRRSQRFFLGLRLASNASTHAICGRRIICGLPAKTRETRRFESRVVRSLSRTGTSGRPTYGSMPTPGRGSPSVRWIQQVGWGNAMRHLLTADRFDAAEAFRIGLVHEVVPPGRVLERCTELATQIASNAPLAVRATKESSLRYLADGQATAFSMLETTQASLAKSADAMEGALAMTETSLRDVGLTARTFQPGASSCRA